MLFEIIFLVNFFQKIKGISEKSFKSLKDFGSKDFSKNFSGQIEKCRPFFYYKQHGEL